MNTKQHRAWMEKAERLSKAIQLSFPSDEHATYVRLLAEHLQLLLRPCDVQDMLESEDDDVRMRDEFIRREGYVPFPWNAPRAAFGGKGSFFSPPGFRPAGGAADERWNSHWMQAPDFGRGRSYAEPRPGSYGNRRQSFTPLRTQADTFWLDTAKHGGLPQTYIEVGRATFLGAQRVVKRREQLHVSADAYGRYYISTPEQAPRYPGLLTAVAIVTFESDETLVYNNTEMILCRDPQGLLSAYLASDTGCGKLVRTYSTDTTAPRPSGFEGKGFQETIKEYKWGFSSEGIPETAYLEILRATYRGETEVPSHVDAAMHVWQDKESGKYFASWSTSERPDEVVLIARAHHLGNPSLVKAGCEILVCEGRDGGRYTFSLHQNGDEGPEGGRLRSLPYPQYRPATWGTKSDQKEITEVQWVSGKELKKPDVLYTELMRATYMGPNRVDLRSGVKLHVHQFTKDGHYFVDGARDSNIEGSKHVMEVTYESVDRNVLIGEKMIVCGLGADGNNVVFMSADVLVGNLMKPTAEQLQRPAD